MFEFDQPKSSLTHQIDQQIADNQANDEEESDQDDYQYTFTKNQTKYGNKLVDLSDAKQSIKIIKEEKHPQPPDSQ